MKRIFALLSILTLAVAANAGVINGSFEEPGNLSPGQFTTAVAVPGWTGITGVWRIPNTTFFNASPPDGLNIGYSNGVGTAQILSDTVQVGLHTASIMAGRRGDSFAGSFTFRMYAGGSINTNGLVSGGTVLAEQFFDHTTVAANSFTPMSLSYTALEGDSLIGQQIIIAMVKGQGAQMNFDKVEFNSPVPEPATLLIGLGLIPLLRKKRKA